MQEIEAVHEAEYRAVLGRIRWLSLVAWIVFAIALGLLRGWRAVVGLTCSAAVVMINFLWLEEIIRRTLRPAPQVKFWRVFASVMVRLALLGSALAVTIVVARFEALSVILGFSIIVVGIMGEAARSAVIRLDDGR